MALAPRLPLYPSSGTPADSVVSRGSRHKNLRPDRCRQRPESRCHELKTVQKVLGSRPLQVLQWNRGLNRTFMMGENLGSDPLVRALSSRTFSPRLERSVSVHSALRTLLTVHCILLERCWLFCSLRPNVVGCSERKKIARRAARVRYYTLQY